MKRLLSVFLASLLVLSACSSDYSYQQKVNISPEQRAAAEAKIQALQTAIAQFVPKEGTPQPDSETIEMVRQYQILGEVGKGIQAYENLMKTGYTSIALLHNTGRLYEDAHDYPKAVEYYQKIINEYHMDNYYYDIAWAWIYAKDAQKAGEAYSKWATEMKTNDVDTQLAIKKLKEK